MKKHDEDIPEFLRELKHDKPFATPPNYFRNMQDEVMTRIGNENAASVNVSLWEQLVQSIQGAWLRPAMAFGAVAVLIVASFILSGDRQGGELALSEEFSQEQLEQYLLANLDEFDEAYLYQEEITAIDWIEETEISEESEEIWEGLLDDLDEQTLQEIF